MFGVQGYDSNAGDSADRDHGTWNGNLVIWDFREYLRITSCPHI